MMSKKAKMIALILFAAAGYLLYLNEKRVRCLAHGGEITYRTVESAGPNTDLKTGVPNAPRKEMMCVGGDGTVMF